MCSSVHFQLTLVHCSGNHQFLRRGLCGTSVKEDTVFQREKLGQLLLMVQQNVLGDKACDKTHLSWSVFIRAVWNASLLAFQESSEGQIVVTLLINHLCLLSEIFSIGTSRTRQPHVHLALYLDKRCPTSTFTNSSSGLSGKARSSILGPVMFCSCVTV